MNASLIDDFHSQFQRLVEELKQSLGKELEKKAGELYALFLYHLSAAYNPRYAGGGGGGLHQLHQLPSSLASPLASPLAAGPRGLHPAALNHQQLQLNALISPRNHLPQQSTFFFRAPPLNTAPVNTGQNNSISANNAVVGSSPGQFHPVPGPPVMMEFAETAQSSNSSSRRNGSNLLSHHHQQHQQHQHQHLQLQQHQSLGAITKAASLVTGLPLHHQQQQLQNLSQHVSVISKPVMLPSGQALAATATETTATAAPPPRPQIQKAPAVPTVFNGHPLPQSSSSSSSMGAVQPQVLTSVVQNAQPTTTATAKTGLKVPSSESSLQNYAASAATVSQTPVKKSTSTLPPPTTSSPPSQPPPPPPPPPPLKSPLETSSSSSIPETVKEVTSTSATNDTKSSSLTNKAAKSPEPMDLSRTSPTLSKFQNNKKDIKDEKKSDSSDDSKNKSKKCDCSKCNEKENQNKENDTNDENEDDEDDDDDDDDEEEEEDNENENNENENEDEIEDENEDENEDEVDDNENDENRDEVDELEDENVQVDSDDDDSYFLDDIEKSKLLLNSRKTHNGNIGNINNLTFNLTSNRIPEKRFKPDQPDTIDKQKDQSNNKNCHRALSLQSQSFIRSNYKKHSLRRSFSLDFSTIINNGYSEQQAVFSPLSPPAISTLKSPQLSESTKNNCNNTNGTGKSNGQTLIVNGGSKGKLESILPQLPLPSTGSTTKTSATAATAVVSGTAVDTKVRHFKTLSVKCLLDDCPATFQKLEELDEHLIQHHCILPHRCVMQGCSLSFSST